MVNERLHIICGNCGCNHEFTYRAAYEPDDDDVPQLNVTLCCNNCGTLHFLDTMMTRDDK